MASIKNIKGLSTTEINRELSNGAKFITFQYCISIVVMTFKRTSSIYFVKAHETPLKYSIGYTFVSLFFGWWGIPWGPIYTVGSLYRNLSGGKDITTDVIKALNTPSAK